MPTRRPGLVQPEPVAPGATAGSIILGTASNDRLLGGAENEIFLGGGGNDQINGGGGTDTALFSGPAAGFEWRLLDDGVTWRIRDLDRRAPQADEGNDFLVGIERLRFDDRIVLLAADTGPVAGADSATMAEDGGAILIDVLGNDGDADGDRLSIDTARFTYTLVSDLGGLPVYDLAGRLVSPATATATSMVTVAAVNDLPTGGVTLAGTAAVGQVLTAANTLADADGMGAVSYQWQRGVAAGEGVAWQDIAGATGGTYALTAADGGAEIRAVARYTDGGGTQEGVASDAVSVEPGGGGGFRMLDMNLFAAALEQYNERTVDFALVAEGASNGWLSVTFDLLEDAGIVNFFEGAWAWVNISTGSLPGGQVRTATFRATDTNSGATDDGTLTLHRLDGPIVGFELAGGDGMDVFLPPNGGGTIRGGAGDDVLLALSVAGDLVALGESGFDALQVESLDGNLLLDGGAGGSLVVANGVTGSAELRTGPDGGQAIASGVVGSLVLRGGAGTDQFIATGNLGTMLLEGGAGDDVLSAYANARGAVMDGGAGADVYALDPTPGRTTGNTIILRKGEVAGDQITGFDGDAGDRLMLLGFGDGATLTRGAAPSEWRVTAVDGSEEFFRLQGAAFDAGTDALWM